MTKRRVVIAIEEAEQIEYDPELCLWCQKKPAPDSDFCSSECEKVAAEEIDHIVAAPAGAREQEPA